MERIRVIQEEVNDQHHSKIEVKFHNFKVGKVRGNGAKDLMIKIEVKFPSLILSMRP